MNEIEGGWTGISCDPWVTGAGWDPLVRAIVYESDDVAQIMLTRRPKTDGTAGRSISVSQAKTHTSCLDLKPANEMC